MFFEDEELPEISQESHNQGLIAQAQACGFAQCFRAFVCTLIKSYNAGGESSVYYEISRSEFDKIEKTYLKLTTINRSFSELINEYLKLYASEHWAVIDSINYRQAHGFTIRLNETGTMKFEN